MTVKELIEELSQYPEDTIVYCGTDHCESTDKVGSVVKYDYKWVKEPGIEIIGMYG